MRKLVLSWLGRDEEVVKHDSTYDSVFTYNTEREFTNRYQNMDAYRIKMNPINEPGRSDFLNKRLEESKDTVVSNLIEMVCVLMSVILLILTLPFSLIFSLKFVASFERMVLFRMGKAQKVYGPGTTLILPLIDSFQRVDVRVCALHVPTIHIISSDKGIAEIDVAVFAKVNDPLTAVCTLQEKDKILKNIAYTALYNKFVRQMITDMQHPHTVARTMEEVKIHINEFVAGSGVEVTDVTVAQMKILQQGENQSANVFQTILSSDVGKQLLSVVGEHIGTDLLQPGKFQMMDGVPLTGLSGMMAGPQNGTAFPNLPNFVPVDPQPSMTDSATVNALVDAVNRCCSSQLTAKVNRSFRVQCEYESRIYELDLDLREGVGRCTALTDPQKQFDMTLALPYSTLKGLIDGGLSAVSEYINGNIRVSGSIQDAMSLQHLASRASELGISLPD